MIKLPESVAAADPSLEMLAAYHSAINAVANICIASRDGVLVYANDKFCESRGYTREELLGTTHLLLDAPRAEFDKKLREVQETVDTGQTWRGQIQNKRKNGELYYVNVSIVPSSAVNGQVQHYYIISYDVTDQVLALQQLQESHAQLREDHSQLQTVLQLNPPDWIWEVNGNLRYTSVTSGNGKVHVDHLIGKEFREAAINHSDYKWQVQQDRMLSHSDFWDFEYCVPRSAYSNEPLWLNISAKAKIENGVFMGYHGVAQDITDRRLLEQKLWDLLHLDSLTLLPNRNYFKTLLDYRIQNRGAPFALVLLDIDDFNQVNATLGSATGDVHLKLVADTLRTAMPPTDVIARMSSDEFAVILEGVHNEAQAKEWVEYLIAALDKPYAKTSGGRCCVSVGACWYPEHGGNLEHILRAAELALRKAQAQGGGRYAFFEESLLIKTLQRQILSTDVHQSIDVDNLCIQYQPVVNLTTGKINSLEALMFCEHPAYPQGRIGAGEILKLSSDHYLWAKIGHRVVDRVLAQIATWKLMHVPFGKVAINVTSADFTHGDVVRWIADRLAFYRVKPTEIIIELTEGICFIGEESEKVKQGVYQLDTMGIEIAFDDFGTGYTSLRDLPLPVSRIKIDRSFVEDITTNEHHAQTIQALSQLTQATGRSLVIEGVETLEQLQAVCRKGCHLIQGYLFSKALPAHEVETLLLHFNAQRTLQQLHHLQSTRNTGAVAAKNPQSSAAKEDSPC